MKCCNVVLSFVAATPTLRVGALQVGALRVGAMQDWCRGFHMFPGNSLNFGKFRGIPGKPSETTAPIVQRTSPHRTNLQRTNPQRWCGGDKTLQRLHTIIHIFTQLHTNTFTTLQNFDTLYTKRNNKHTTLYTYYKT